MENFKTHIVSIFAVLFLFLFAVGCEFDPDEFNCGVYPAYGLYASEPITTGTSKQVTYQITLLDKETNLPVPDITVKVYISRYDCVPLREDCPEVCYYQRGKKSGDVSEQIGLSDGNGIYSGTTDWIPRDKKDVLSFSFAIKDENLLQYSYKKVLKEFKVSDNNLTITTYLLNDDLL